MKLNVLFFTLIVMPASLMASEQLLLLDFAMDSIEICEDMDTCKDVERSKLPSKELLPIEVTNYDRKTGMLSYNFENKNYLVHQSEVILNQTAESSFPCTAQTTSRKSDESTFGSLGLGKGCQE